MTLVEFLSPLKTAAAWKKVLGVLYFKKRYEDTDAMTVEQIRAALLAARVPRAKSMNISDVLGRSGEYVDSPRAEGGRRLWSITDTGEREIRGLLGLPGAEPEIEHDVATLTKLVSKLRDPGAKDFIEEAIKCLQVGALRAAVVFLWTGAIQTLRAKAWKKGADKVNAAISTHDPKGRTLRKAEDFANVKDSVFLRALQDLGVIDKGEKGTLEEALNLRNRCGHPTRYKPGVNKASSFIEDVVGIVF
jgi:hypothetical protein